jgi:ethanolamine utilization protein EutP (predicted NTPase)
MYESHLHSLGGAYSVFEHLYWRLLLYMAAQNIEYKRQLEALESYYFNHAVYFSKFLARTQSAQCKMVVSTKNETKGPGNNSTHDYLLPKNVCVGKEAIYIFITNNRLDDI